MTFEEALAHLKRGSRIRRKNMFVGGIYCAYGHGKIVVNNESGKRQSPCFYLSDIVAEDWEIVPDDASH